MRTLYFSPRSCWPADTGARLRDLHLARHLARISSLTYLGFTAGPSSKGPLPALDNATVSLVNRGSGYAFLNLARGITGPLPFSVLNYASTAMSAELHRLLHEEPFDTIQIEGPHLWTYVEQIRKAAPRAALICDWHNVESELMRRYADNAAGEHKPGFLKRWYAARTADLLEHCEDALLKAADIHTVCSGREREILERRVPNARVQVVPNGVDVKYYAASDQIAPDGPERDTLVFVGSMDYHANVDAAVYFAHSIWPKIAPVRERLKFVVVGARPTPEVMALGNELRVQVTGTVDDVRPYYRNALAVVVPLRVGSGTRLKVLEAMAAGVPVVSTSLGAEGLAVETGKNILIQDTPEGMARVLLQLNEGTPEWKELVSNARSLVTEHYDWAVSGLVLQAIHRDLSVKS